MERIYLEGLVIGLCIGIAAMLLENWVGYESWRVRLIVLLVTGGALCVLQYYVARFRRR
ncbi:MAG: hypothetical protein OHK0015_22330 [Chloroflexi bacterium OHK40]